MMISTSAGGLVTNERFRLKVVHTHIRPFHVWHLHIRCPSLAAQIKIIVGPGKCLHVASSSENFCRFTQVLPDM